MKITNTKIYGLEESIIASGYPMQTELPDDISDLYFEIYEDLYDDIDYKIKSDSPHFKRAVKLGNTKAGEAHDKFLRGIIVQADIIAPRFFWQEWDTYHYTENLSSQSTMHCASKFDISAMANNDVNPTMLEILKAHIEAYNINPTNENLHIVKSNWLEGIELGRRISTNYAQLKTMYKQRYNHRLPEWSEVFINWCDEELPYFKELCLKNIIISQKIGGNK